MLQVVGSALTWWGSLIRIQSRLPNPLKKSVSYGSPRRGTSNNFQNVSKIQWFLASTILLGMPS